MKKNNLKFWDIFCGDYTKNCLKWVHASENPVFPAMRGNLSWKSRWTANPDYLEYDGKRLIYYRGNGFSDNNNSERHDRIAVAELLKIDSSGISFVDLNNGKYIIDIGPDGDFDCKEALDPAAVIFDGKVFLYYSAIGNGPDAVGLAISSDGVNFRKMGKVMDGRAPDVIMKDREIFMIYQKHGEKGYVGFYLAKSIDGHNFINVSDEPVFIASASNNWDCQLTTARLFEQGDSYYMLYGGNPSLVDQPCYFGLAKSSDLLHWERHPGNPIFGCGRKGEPDGGAIWFPALIEMNESYVLMYEGSRGDYNWDLSSEICMASLAKEKIV